MPIKYWTKKVGDPEAVIAFLPKPSAVLCEDDLSTEELIVSAWWNTTGRLWKRLLDSDKYTKWMWGKPVWDSNHNSLQHITSPRLLSSSRLISRRHAASTSGLGLSRMCRHHLRADSFFSSVICFFGDLYNLWGGTHSHRHMDQSDSR